MIIVFWKFSGSPEQKPSLWNKSRKIKIPVELTSILRRPWLKVTVTKDLTECLCVSSMQHMELGGDSKRTNWTGSLRLCVRCFNNSIKYQAASAAVSVQHENPSYSVRSPTVFHRQQQSQHRERKKGRGGVWRASNPPCDILINPQGEVCAVCVRI